MRTSRGRRHGLVLLIVAAALSFKAHAPARAQAAAPGQAAPARVPAPADIFGFAPGTDYRLADYDQVHRYFQALDAASDRVLLENIGTTTLGRPMIVALISSEENLRNRERYREINRRLALAKELTDDEARRLAREGKVTVWIDGGLHSTEVGHSHTTRRVPSPDASGCRQQSTRSTRISTRSS